MQPAGNAMPQAPAEGGRYDAYCAGQLRALEELKLVEAARVEAVLRPGAHRLCGCWF